MVKHSKVTLGGIIQCGGGIGFKTIFEDKETAQKYKDMFMWILKDDKFIVKNNMGYYDDKEMKQV